MDIICNKYKILSQIKNDNKGRVFLAEHIHIGVKRIIKECAPNEVIRQNLMHEAYVLNRLKHSHIPALIDTENNGDSFYVIEEYIDGECLYDYIKKNGVLDSRQALSYAGQLSHILEYLHSSVSLKVCHLDIQPKNIILKDGNVYLIDFGSSRLYNDSDQKLPSTATGGFAPPWQYDTHFGENMEEWLAADIYGFGAVLLYMVTGKLPDDNVIKSLKQSKISETLVDIITLTLNKEIRYRQKNISIICKRLDRAHTCDTTWDYAYERTPSISVVGAGSGAGTTYVSLAMAEYIRAMKYLPLYEEKNSTDMIRIFAGAHPEIPYDRGCFIYHGIRLKPNYENDIATDIYSDVLVRDEGEFKNTQIYGDMIILVISPDEWGLCKAVSALEHISVLNIPAFVICNQCTYSEYKKVKGHIQLPSAYLEHGETLASNSGNSTLNNIKKNIVNLIKNR